MMAKLSDQVFLEAATAIDAVLEDTVVARFAQLGPADVAGIYERLSLMMAFHTIGLIMAVAREEVGGRRAVDMFVAAQPLRIRKGAGARHRAGPRSARRQPEPQAELKGPAWPRPRARISSISKAPST